METAKLPIRCAPYKGFVDSYLTFPGAAEPCSPGSPSRFSPQLAGLLTPALARDDMALLTFALQIQLLAQVIVWNGRCSDEGQRVRVQKMTPKRHSVGFRQFKDISGKPLA